MEFEQIKKIIHDQIRLSPFDPKKEINILTMARAAMELGLFSTKTQMKTNPG